MFYSEITGRCVRETSISVMEFNGFTVKERLLKVSGCETLANFYALHVN